MSRNTNEKIYDPVIKICEFQLTCKIMDADGPNNCQYQTVIDTYLARRQKETEVDKNALDFNVLDALTRNKQFINCPRFFEITGDVLDKIGDAGRYRIKKIRSPRNLM